jgi:hypothetical protein
VALLSTRSHRIRDITRYLGFGCPAESDMVVENKYMGANNER